VERPYQMEYHLNPAFEAKMRKVFEKHNLEWDWNEWQEGDMVGKLVGSKDNLIAFTQEVFRDHKGRKLSRKAAAEDIEEADFADHDLQA